MFLVTECLKTLRINNCPQEKGAVPLSDKTKIKRNLIWTFNRENENLLSRLRLPAGSFFFVENAFSRSGEIESLCIEV